ncbi:hypothetical protein GCM10010095_72230 [Streptomyces anthocyanicus]|uniref:Uncharacterized protein n=1 Tax=Streptomyces violaceolatus TaxID=67378 RepID=A0ABN3TGP3_9ACTN|nr:hypothetical protein [Streptomyces anthocyanicus]GGL76656.1 hypothetical protein GCM10010095_72230 [Streptomyces anthocyanicus]GHC32811.1 hypothetical protein GCM10010348_69570 [Streptomyces anthocyanicus]
MENTRSVERAEGTGAPITDAEKEQAGYTLRAMTAKPGDPEALLVSREWLALVQPFFELGWAMGVRTGNTGMAVAGVPVTGATVARAFAQLNGERAADLLARGLEDPQSAGPSIWQRVRYHGSLTQAHGTYWVCAIHAHGDPLSMLPTLRYDLCELRGDTPVPVVKNVRRVSLTPLGEWLTAL